MSRSELEILILSIDARLVIGIGFVCAIVFCLISISISGRRFPGKHLLVIWSMVVLTLYTVPSSIKAYALRRLTDDDNLFFLSQEAVGTSYPALLASYNRWSDMQLAFLTGSILIVPSILVGLAYSSALLLFGAYRFVSRSE